MASTTNGDSSNGSRGPSRLGQGQTIGNGSLTPHSALSQELPEVVYGHFLRVKKGEDYYYEEAIALNIPGAGDEETGEVFHAFAVFDGHNGTSGAIYAKDHLVSNIINAMPAVNTREEWCRFLPQAMVAAFVKTDMDFARLVEEGTQIDGGCTATVAIVCGWTVTVACVGDSRCIFSTVEGEPTVLSIDHNLRTNPEEEARINRDGGRVIQEVHHGVPRGPPRIEGVGLAVSRSIGDVVGGVLVVGVPSVQQIELSRRGGRLIIASDGLWDTLSNRQVAGWCRKCLPEKAAESMIKEAIDKRGLRDDTTAIVVDIRLAEDEDLNQSQPTGCCFTKKPPRPPLEDSRPTTVFQEDSPYLVDRLKEIMSRSKTSEDDLVCAICRRKVGTKRDLERATPSPDTAAYQGPWLCKDCKAALKDREGVNRPGIPVFPDFP